MPSTKSKRNLMMFSKFESINYGSEFLNVSPISLFAEPTPVVAEEEMQMGAPDGH